MVLAEISIKLIFLPKRKESSVRVWLFKYILWPKWFAYELYRSNVQMTRNHMHMQAFMFLEEDNH